MRRGILGGAREGGYCPSLPLLPPKASLIFFCARAVGCLQVLAGMEVVKAVEALGSPEGRPSRAVVVTAAGELPL